MNTIKSKIIFIILILGLISIAGALLFFTQKPAFAQSDTPEPQSPSENSLVEGTKDLDVLEGQLEVMTEYTDRLMSTVQWALGIVVGVLVVIL